MKTISKIAFKAHNNGAEFPCYNEVYNKAHKLGSMADRTLLRKIAIDIYGLGEGKHKLTLKDIETWSNYRDDSRAEVR